MEFWQRLKYIPGNILYRVKGLLATGDIYEKVHSPGAEVVRKYGIAPTCENPDSLRGLCEME